MVKVQKDTLVELVANFSEIFEGANANEATEKAHSSEKPSDKAKITITNQRIVRSNIKLVGEEMNDTRTEKTQGSGIQTK